MEVFGFYLTRGERGEREEGDRLKKSAVGKRKKGKIFRCIAGERGELDAVESLTARFLDRH